MPWSNAIALMTTQHPDGSYVTPIAIVEGVVYEIYTVEPLEKECGEVALIREIERAWFRSDVFEAFDHLTPIDLYHCDVDPRSLYGTPWEDKYIDPLLDLLSQDSYLRDNDMWGV